MTPAVAALWEHLCLLLIPENNLIHLFHLFCFPSIFLCFCPPLSSLSLPPFSSALFLPLFFLLISFLLPLCEDIFVQLTRLHFSSRSISRFSHLFICYCSGSLGVVSTEAVSLPHSAEYTAGVPQMLPESEQACACLDQHMCPLTTDPCDPLTPVDSYCNYS